MAWRHFPNKWYLNKQVIFVFCLLPFALFSKAFGQQSPSVQVHDALFIEEEYPSALQCKACHPAHFEEWSASPHAYAQLSPVFNAMHTTIVKRTNGTNGDFCIRCHTPIGMNLNEPIVMSNLNRSKMSVEGVTCIVCHRRPEEYGKVSGRMAIKEGDIFEPVYGSAGRDVLDAVIESGEFDINTERGKPGRAIHTEARYFPQITRSGFCSGCHDVNSVDSFRLEEAFSEYKAAPAAREGTTCQDCHMGIEPGVPSGYASESVAIIGGKPTKPRKRTNHMFVGPDYSIIHPGIFPHNQAAQDMATYREWLTFDYEAGWGTDDFEDMVLDNQKFPARWASVVDRYEARDVINENIRRLKKAEIQRKKLLQTGYTFGDIVVDQADETGITFKVEVKNGTLGHNVPTGFDADRLVFIQVMVTDQNGTVLLKSGDLDPNGDLRDSHSAYVKHGELPEDKQLYSLQSVFLIRMLRGGERKEVLPINYSADPLPFVRPASRANILQGRPDGARKHRQTIPPRQSQWAKYKVKKSALKGSQGPYTANIKIIAGMIPVNLVNEIKDVGFDYGMSPRQVADAVVAGHQVLWEKNIRLAPGRMTEHSTIGSGKNK